MKITKLRLVGANNVDLPLEGVGPLTPYVLKAADGLGPPEVDVSVVSMLATGGYYQGRRPQLRQVILRVGLQPEWNIGQTPQELRSALYGLLTPSLADTLYLQLIDGSTTIAQAECQVSKMEVAAFSKDPEVQITLNCFQPYFEALYYDAQKPTVTGTSDGVVFNVDNDGTAESPFYIAFQFKTPTTAAIRLTDVYRPNQFIEIVNRTFALDDVLIINTRPGSRGVWRQPAGSTARNNILDKLNPDSTWLQLHHGENPLRFSEGLFVWPEDGIRVTPRYWGI